MYFDKSSKEKQFNDSERSKYIELYNLKNAFFEYNDFEELNCEDFYSYIYNGTQFQFKGIKTTDRVTNPLLTYTNNHNTLSTEIMFADSDYSHAYGNTFACLAPATYFGKTRVTKYMDKLFALAIDFDGCDSNSKLKNFLADIEKNVLIKPTFIVNSGTGMHLYFVFDTFIKLNPYNMEVLNIAKEKLIDIFWNSKYSNLSEKPQYQKIHQIFRCPESNSSLGKNYPVRAFKMGDRISVDKLLKYVSKVSNQNLCLTGEHYTSANIKLVKKPRKIKVKKNKDTCYKFLEAFLKSEQIKYGHRYYTLTILCGLAKEYGITKSELKEQFKRFEEPFNSSFYPSAFTKQDFDDALKLYDSKKIYCYTNAYIEKHTGVRFEKKKPKRTKAEHLAYCRELKKAKQQPKTGYDTKERQSLNRIVDVLVKNVNKKLTKTELAKLSGVTRPTLYKFLDEACKLASSITKKECSKEAISSDIYKKNEYNKIKNIMLKFADKRGSLICSKTELSRRLGISVKTLIKYMKRILSEFRYKTKVFFFKFVKLVRPKAVKSIFEMEKLYQFNEYYSAMLT